VIGKVGQNLSVELRGASWNRAAPDADNPVMPSTRLRRSGGENPRVAFIAGAEAMSGRVASCSCGKLTAVARGEPTRVSICHCLACQKRTGSVFGVQARFPEDAVTIAGASTEYARVGDEGTTARFHFCPQCGAIVYYLMDAIPGFIAIPVGAFADPDFPPPRVSVYEVRRHPWVRPVEGIERTE
jgi:hypothetical protein